MHWHQLSELSQLAHIKDISKEQHFRAVLILKHSTRCSISSMVLSRMEAKWIDRDDVPCYYLDLIAHRDISNQLAIDYGVEHESPQVLLIKDGVCFFHTSHTSISAAAINEALG